MKQLLRSKPIRRIAVLTIASALILAVWAFWWEPSSLDVIEQTIAVKRWHVEHEGLRIAVLSDLHVGAPHRDLASLQELVSITNKRTPDLVVILGDLVIQGVLGGRFVPPEDIAKELSRLRAPLGVVAVLGNHDWWLDGERVRRTLSSEGITVLTDQNFRVTYNNRSFWLMGLDDLWTRGNHLKATLASIHDDEPIIALSHNPDIFPEMPPRVSLTLAGHTHGGQVNLPVIGRPIVPSRFDQRFAYGLIEENGRKLFVTGGVGTSILPVRFRVKPEVVIVTVTGMQV